MELKFDTSKTYAFALEGGGARGAYQVGAWRALEENGVKYNAVAGSSVGSLNGALMAMQDLTTAEELWDNMKFSMVMDVDDSMMKNLMKGKLLDLDIKGLNSKVKTIIRGGGFDVTPLKKLIAETVDTEKIKKSNVNLYICTHSLTDRKGLEINVKTLGDEEIKDMLLASAYFPAFKHEKLQGKMFTDGGISNVLPLSPLINAGYKEIIAIRLYGLGVEKKIKIPKNTRVYEIAPRRDLGNMLNFDAEACRKNYRLGYFDAMRMLYGLFGDRYYIDRTLSETEAYDILCTAVLQKNMLSEDAVSLKMLHEMLMKLSKESGAKGDYYDVLVAVLEKSATKLHIEELSIYTDVGLLEKITAKKLLG